MIEIDFEKAGFREIQNFATNLLEIDRLNRPANYDAQIEYFSSCVRILLARSAARESQALAGEIDNARLAAARGLDKLTQALNDAAGASDRAGRRLQYATWALVGVTLLLVIVTGVLAFR